MNGRTLALTIATTLGATLTLTVLIGEGLNYKYNDTLDPRAPSLRSRLSSLENSKIGLTNKEVQKFYKNNGEGFLIATPIEGKANEFTFKYYIREQKSEALEAAKKEGCLKNWSAVSKFLEINKIANSKLSEENISTNTDFTEYAKKHWNDPTVKKILEGKNVKLQYIDLNCAAVYAEQALHDEKIKPEELNALLNDMPQSCIDSAIYILMGSSASTTDDMARFIMDPGFETLDEDFKANIGNHLDDPFLKKISPNLSKYAQNLNIKQFGFRLFISRQLGIVTADEIIDFMGKVVPNFLQRYLNIITPKL